MSMAWERTHRRYELTQAVLTHVARTGRAELSPGLLGEIDELYGDVDTFVSDLRRRWCLTFDARLDALLEDPPPDPAAAVAGLRRELDRELPAYRILFDAHPARAAVDDHHRATLAAATAHARTRRVS